MVEDLQRSVAFFSRSNAGLKMRNAELERQILLAKQRIAGGSNGGMGAMDTIMGSGGGGDNTMLGLMMPTMEGEEDEAAQAAHFAATQAMYKSMGFPPAAARQAAATFASTYKSNDRGYNNMYAPEAASHSNIDTNSVGLSLSTSPDEDQAQAAHFTATQALYKSMGFPPRAAKEAASSLSHCHLGGSKASMNLNLKPAADDAAAPVNLDVKPAAIPTNSTAASVPPEAPLSSSLQALNQYVMQHQQQQQAKVQQQQQQAKAQQQQQAKAQQQAANAAASLAAILQAANYNPTPALPNGNNVVTQPFSFPNVNNNSNAAVTNQALMELIAKLCQNQRT